RGGRNAPCIGPCIHTYRSTLLRRNHRYTTSNRLPARLLQPSCWWNGRFRLPFGQEPWKAASQRRERWHSRRAAASTAERSSYVLLWLCDLMAAWEGRSVRVETSHLHVL